MCCTEKGCNCCAPTCCNADYAIDLYTPDGKYINSSSFVWPGWNCAGLTDRSNIAVSFPDGASANDRASLVAGMMLIEYAVMELKRQQWRSRIEHGTAPTSALPPLRLD